jgi:hypothetical protein
VVVGLASVTPGSQTSFALLDRFVQVTARCPDGFEPGVAWGTRCDGFATAVDQMAFSLRPIGNQGHQEVDSFLDTIERTVAGPIETRPYR